jgi:hypothetical protein
VDGQTIWSIQLSSWLILLAATGGRLTAPLFWLTATGLGEEPGLELGTIPTIKYGPIEGSMTEICFPMFVADVPDTAGDMEPQDAKEQWWASMLSKSWSSMDVLVDEAVMGGGNLWVFRRPDRLVLAWYHSPRTVISLSSRFPVSEAFSHPLDLVSCPIGVQSEFPGKRGLETLPMEVFCSIIKDLPLFSLLNLLRLDKRYRQKLQSSIDDLVGLWLKAQAPHLLPHRVDGPHGTDEVDWWDARVSDAGGAGKPFPWLAYVRACRRSPSMRNRERIWGIVKQIEQAAKELGLIS